MCVKELAFSIDKRFFDELNVPKKNIFVVKIFEEFSWGKIFVNAQYSALISTTTIRFI